jgi:glutamate/tyrosine decarboxylase-like PLP-dependent enzyme
VESDPLALSQEEMRAFGYRAVDLLVDELADRERPPVRRAERAEMARLLAEPAPEEARGAEALERLFADVVPHAARPDHPRFLAFVPTSGTWPGAVGDLVASALNVYAASWLEAPGPTQLELTVLDWFKEWIGYPAEADGQLTTGGSHATLCCTCPTRLTRRSRAGRGSSGSARIRYGCCRPTGASGCGRRRSPRRSTPTSPVG